MKYRVSAVSNDLKSFLSIISLYAMFCHMQVLHKQVNCERTMYIYCNIYLLTKGLNAVMVDMHYAYRCRKHTLWI